MLSFFYQPLEAEKITFLSDYVRMGYRMMIQNMDGVDQIYQQPQILHCPIVSTLSLVDISFSNIRLF